MSTTNSATLRCETPGRPLLLARNDERRVALLFRPRCKTWRCPACAEINRRLWIVKVAHGAEQLLEKSDQLRMITLTSHARLTADGSIAVFRDAWPNLRKRAQRRQKSMAYAMIPERQQNGRIHVHALSNTSLGTRWWKDHGAAVGLGWRNEEEPVRSLWRAAYYANKYLNKETAQTEWPRGFRRVRCSRNWPRLPKPERPSGWAFQAVEWDTALADLIEVLESHGYHCLRTDHIDAWDVIDALDVLSAPV